MREVLIPMQDGKKIYARYYNNHHTQTLLYLHGGPGTSCFTYQYCAHRLSRFVNVVMIDERGVLRSDKIEEDGECTVNMLVKDCEEVRKYLNINKFIVSSHSFGGFIALKYAAEYPDSVESVIFENPAFYFYESTKSIQERLIKTLIKEHLDILADSLNFNILNSYEGINTFLNKLREVPEEIRNKAYHMKNYSDYSEEQKRYLSIKVDSQERYQYALVHLEKIMKDKNMYENIFGLLPKLKCSSLLISGEYDPVFDKNSIKKYKENTDCGKVVVVKDCGHFVHTDCSDEYVKILHEFICS